MSDLQKEAVTSSNMGKTYLKLNAVIGQIHDRFKMKEIMDLAGIKHSFQSRMTVKAVLQRDLKCTEVGYTSVVWKKP